MAAPLTIQALLQVLANTEQLVNGFPEVNIASQLPENEDGDAASETALAAALTYVRANTA